MSNKRDLMHKFQWYSPHIWPSLFSNLPVIGSYPSQEHLKPSWHQQKEHFRKVTIGPLGAQQPLPGSAARHGRPPPQSKVNTIPRCSLRTPNADPSLLRRTVGRFSAPDPSTTAHCQHSKLCMRRIWAGSV